MARKEIQGFSGIVLTGGRSRRMGRDKAQILVHGETLLARQVRVLREAGVSEVIVVQHPHRSRWMTEDLPEVRWVTDDPTYPDSGPLAGLVAGLEAARGSWVAVSAVDFPEMTARWWQKLTGLLRPGQGSVGLSSDDFFEPLAAIYPRSGSASARARLLHGDFALQPWVRQAVAEGWMRPCPVEADDSRELSNWNAPPDWQRT